MQANKNEDRRIYLIKVIELCIQQGIMWLQALKAITPEPTKRAKINLAIKQFKELADTVKSIFGSNTIGFSNQNLNEIGLTKALLESARIY